MRHNMCAGAEEDGVYDFETGCFCSGSRQFARFLHTSGQKHEVPNASEMRARGRGNCRDSLELESITHR